MSATRITFYSNIKQKELLEQWAKEEDSNISHIIRKCIRNEQLRRHLEETPADKMLRQLGSKELFPA